MTAVTGCPAQLTRRISAPAPWSSLSRAVLREGSGLRRRAVGMGAQAGRLEAIWRSESDRQLMARGVNG
jgi:hypothetical protein